MLFFKEDKVKKSSSSIKKDKPERITFVLVNYYTFQLFMSSDAQTL